MFKVNYKNTKTRCEICSKLTIKTQERRQNLKRIVNGDKLLTIFVKKAP